jgi:isoquinoline 1-oxidoreductase subunit beta
MDMQTTMENTNGLASEARRDFMKASAAAGAGALVIGVQLNANAQSPSTAEFQPNAWVRVGSDNIVTIWCHRSEMGQGVYTSIPMLVAEELEVPLERVKIDMAPAAAPYINDMLGGQITGGSTSVREAYGKLRTAGAAAREMLVAAAAANWGVPVSECTAVNGEVMHNPTKRMLPYGQLAVAASKLKAPEKPTLKSPANFKLIGKQYHRMDTVAKVEGTAVYGIDVKRKGMLIASLAQCPVIGGKVKSVNDSAAKAIKGVEGVINIGEGVAVLAKDYYLAKKGRDALKIEWDMGPSANVNMDTIRAGIRAAMSKPGAAMKKDGDADKAMAGAAKRIEAEYESPYLAHATLEPVNCSAEFINGNCHITGPIQFQQGAQGAAAAVLGLKPEQVFIHTTFLGGGYGRKLELDFIMQAALIAKAAGKPIKMVWSREDDMTHDFYRPMSLHKMEGGLDAQGNLVALSGKMVSQSVTARAFPPVVQNGFDPFMAEGGSNVTYKVPNINLTKVIQDSGVRVGYWRSVSHPLNAFAIECFMDELAKTAGKDPVAFRMGMLGAHPRAMAVLKAASDRAGWGKAAAGRGLGVAQMECYETYTAVVAEVSLRGDTPTVHKLTCVTDCGLQIHPDQVNAQIMSGLLLGFSSAMKNEITFKNGAVQQTNFHDYPMLRMNEVPTIDLQFIGSNEKPGGIGEVGVPLVAAAIANAIAAAGGKRLRKQPLSA